MLRLAFPDAVNVSGKRTQGREGRGDVFSKSRGQCWWWYPTGGIPIRWILSVITFPVNCCGLVHLMPHQYLVYSSLSMEKWLLFKLASSTCQIVFKTGAAAVPVRNLNTVIYHAVQKFLSRKHLLDQERQVHLLPGFEPRGIRFESDVGGISSQDPQCQKEQNEL